MENEKNWIFQEALMELLENSDAVVAHQKFSISVFGITHLQTQITTEKIPVTRTHN